MALEKMVPPHIVSVIAGMSPSDLAGDYMLTWKWSNNGLFSIVNTYTAVAGDEWELTNGGARKKDGFNGATDMDSGISTIGGVLRDANSNRIMGYAKRLGESVFHTEARVLLEGLRLAWENGFRRVEVESDNALLIEAACN
ncbi:hypothetical protein PVK06_028150 [Gossypium arboreum]|uniref:RNase H type-1 domain-containing protein n=1 Tax=Gossypium arboreum TaxID=29729 RepID=A0ABR0P440_GOSAR|nr:hypothetical protein PVK06_028150 [Gossypium arboreum]